MAAASEKLKSGVQLQPVGGPLGCALWLAVLRVVFAFVPGASFEWPARGTAAWLPRAFRPASTGARFSTARRSSPAAPSSTGEPAGVG